MIPRCLTSTPGSERRRLRSAPSLPILFSNKRDYASRDCGRMSSFFNLKRMVLMQGFYLCPNTGKSFPFQFSGRRSIQVGSLCASPFPYHPVGSTKTHGTVADEEGRRLQILLDNFAASLMRAWPGCHISSRTMLLPWEFNIWLAMWFSYRKIYYWLLSHKMLSIILADSLKYNRNWSKNVITDVLLVLDP